MKVLVVDDSSTMRLILKNILREVDYTDVVQARDGNEALEVLGREAGIGLILADWHMPNMDGLSLLEAVQSNNKTKDIPFIMVTTQAERKSVETAITKGASSYVVKPFTPEVLKEKIDEVLA